MTREGAPRLGRVFDPFEAPSVRRGPPAAPSRPVQPWAQAWERRVHAREKSAEPSERERLIAEYKDFLNCAPVRAVVGLELEETDVGLMPYTRTVARLSCGHTQAVWRDGGIRCWACYTEIVAARSENWLET